MLEILHIAEGFAAELKSGSYLTYTADIIRGSADLLFINDLFWLIPVAPFSILLQKIFRRKPEQNDADKLEEFRRMLAGDLHDGIGPDLTHITVLSEAALRELEKIAKSGSFESIETVRGYLNEIGTKSRSSLASMSDIVWVINPRNDLFDNIFSRFVYSISTVLEAKNVEYNIDVSAEVKDRLYPFEYRRNCIFMSREVISNAVRHSGADYVEVSVIIEEDKLIFTCRDNGCGFDPKNADWGNGLKNISERASALGGGVEIKSSSGKGTEVKIITKLP